MDRPNTPNANPSNARLTGLAVWIATAGGVGRAPVAPGTWGSLLGIPLACGIALLPGVWLQAGVLIALAVAGVPICALAVKRLGGPKDPSCIVLDEVVGMAATLFLIDTTRPLPLLAGFLLFRLFDILKPSPVRDVEALPHGWGIMADDLVAALYANISLRLVLWLVGSYFTGSLPAG